ncbi:sugar transferase [Lutimonas halocynthiae]|uniref:sugar transferase n=1 Tax=Lutimonas halocynthiae TaxID=1446477 RepID=UPI0025B427B0|nr:sugar transferase [Lutimonas halocynthiae]MDN3642963.1 sugar transferase [Lutimonas halocynthiae]
MKASLNILYVGNETKSLEKIRYQDNCSLTVLNNNLSAVNYLNTNKQPDAIICDYNLPGNNGMFLFDWIRDRTLYNSTPFILLEREFNSDNFKLAFKKQVDDYFVTSTLLASNLLNRIQYLSDFRNKPSSLEKVVPVQESYKMPLSKRIFDIVLASTALLFAAPFLLLIILAIRLESKGKVYYIAKRVGRKTFDFYKLRSMRTGSDELLKNLAKEKNQYNNVSKPIDHDAEATCPKCKNLRNGKTCSPVMYVDTNEVCEYWHNFQQNKAAENSATFVKISNDPRVTRVGKFIRNTSIDELPQLINVLKGDMSIVGNRPLPVYEAELLTEDTMSKRFLAPAGITGLWQVELRGQGGVMSEAERMKLDNEYADHFRGDNFSFWYDIKLILRTIPALLQKEAV